MAEIIPKDRRGQTLLFLTIFAVATLYFVQQIDKAAGDWSDAAENQEQAARAELSALQARIKATASALAAPPLETLVGPLSGGEKRRVALCRAWGGEVVLVADVREAFATAERIQADEGRTFVHPFEGPLTALGTATPVADNFNPFAGRRENNLKYEKNEASLVEGYKPPTPKEKIQGGTNLLGE